MGLESGHQVDPVVTYRYRCAWHTYGKAEVERRAAISIVCGPEFSSMRSNDGTTDRKAEPHSLCFCGEERLEDLFHFFLWNTTAPIGDGYKSLRSFPFSVLVRMSNRRSGVLQSTIASQALTTRLSNTC